MDSHDAFILRLACPDSWCHTYAWLWALVPKDGLLPTATDAYMLTCWSRFLP